MNRARFMKELERMLSDIPEAERREALDFYDNFLDDAGPEAEDSVLQELGSPGKVAAIIKADLKGGSGEYGEYTERGYQDSRMAEGGQMPAVRGAGQGREEQQEEETFRSGEHEEFRGEEHSWRSRGREHAEEFRRRVKERRKRSSPVLILGIIALVILSPILKGAAGIALLVLLLPVLVVLALAVGSFGFVIFGIAIVVAGIAATFASPAAGILTIGIGFLILAMGILLGIAALWAGGKGLVGLLRKATDGIGRLLHRGKGGTR